MCSDPVTFIPNTELVQYTTATLPSVLVGGLAYYIGMRLFGELDPEARLKR